MPPAPCAMCNSTRTARSTARLIERSSAADRCGAKEISQFLTLRSSSSSTGPACFPTQLQQYAFNLMNSPMHLWQLTFGLSCSQEVLELDPAQMDQLYAAIAEADE